MHLCRISKNTLGYTFYHPAEGKIFVAKTGAFLEKEFLAKVLMEGKLSLTKSMNPHSKYRVAQRKPSIKEEEGALDENQGVLIEQTECSSARVRRSPEWFGNPILSVMLTDQDEPATYTKAMEGPESEKWLEAMKSEIRSMYDNQVWTLVDIPSDCKDVENKWIFKKKTNTDGTVTVYKAWLVAKGF
jgi:hypothetical protein